MYWNLIAIFVGGGIGALLRYGVSLLSTRCLGCGVPGTFAVNMLGCLALGALYGVAQGRLLPGLGVELRLFLGVGLLGALTTFSTLQWELLELLRAERWGWALGYMALSMLCGMLCTCAGYYLTHAR